MTTEEREIARNAARFALAEGSHPVDAAIYAAEKVVERVRFGFGHPDPEPEEPPKGMWVNGVTAEDLGFLATIMAVVVSDSQLHVRDPILAHNGGRLIGESLERGNRLLDTLKAQGA